MKPLKVIFFGTPDFSVPSLEALNKHQQIDLKYVISMPDKKKGRGLELQSPEVIQFAKNNNIPFFQTQNINTEVEFLEKIKKENIDCFVVLAFAQFLSNKLLEIPRLGCFNIHTSILPKYRGAAPIQYAILNGDKETGVSIQKMVAKMDAGDLVYQLPCSIGEMETGGELYARLKSLAAKALNHFIPKLIENDIVFIKQDESKVSFAPTLKREDGALDFKEHTTTNILNQIRALYPWPGTYCFLNNKRLKIFAAELSDIKLTPGEVHTDFNQIIVGCSNGSVRLSSIQLAGKKACTDSELLNGIKDKVIITSKEKT